ncbi:MAG TPA: bifunctional isocitrate dehydrogenase kinase/phosphatase [Patescibacteria group bacterium]|nr:bifunctional isocitrate dehydrogenase kinase/phosphatase [Patescibacteria group bacterium]
MPEPRDQPDAPDAEGASIIAGAFQSYRDRFGTLTCRARRRFEERDWAGAQQDSVARLDLYGEVVDEGLGRLFALLGSRLEDRPTWTAVRTAYETLIAGRADAELAETFFNSFARRIFHTIGVDPGIEFVAPAASRLRHEPPWSHTVVFRPAGSLPDMTRRLLMQFPFAGGYDDLDGDSRLLAQVVTAQLEGRAVESIELSGSVFYRNKGAYLVGQVRAAGSTVPLVVALTNPGGRVVVDAVLTSADEVSIVFSFARSYFFVEMDRPGEMVDWLLSIMPLKPVSELYAAIGFNKHGKTELYRSLLHRLATTDDHFEFAPGQRGMVMCVFTLPGFDVVFKVIRDRFEPPKTVTHEEVRDKYRLVFRHDRAGRLVDAQEFEHLVFDVRRFAEPLLVELLAQASERVAVRDGRVVITHLYTERRLRPLDVYLREAGPAEARAAVVDYGQVLKDLAATNIFPGDMLLKNFGVSRHGRLIFYDYEELCRLTDCHFRILPEPRDDWEDGGAEPWFHVGERDIFPEEFRSFLGLKGDLLETFLKHHADLLSVPFWHRMQEQLQRGEIVDIYPYPAARRLHGADQAASS